MLSIDGVGAHVGAGRRRRDILDSTTLEVGRGESVSVTGRSGAGKSTLADIVLGLRIPDTGRVTVDGRRWCERGHGPTREMRRLVQGVPQDPTATFVPRWTLRQSMELAVTHLTDERDPAEAIARAADLAAVDLALLDRRPAEVSGGQAQRAAIARALAVDPAVIVADEPTSALDRVTADAVITALLDVTTEHGLALLLVTHDPDVAERCHRRHRLTAA